MNTKIVSKKLKLEKYVKVIRDEARVQKEFDSYSKYISPLESEDKEVAVLMSDIENAARTNKILIINVKPQGIVAGKLYKEFGINLEIEAVMENIIKFLYELSKPPYLFKAKRFDFDVKDGDSRLKGSLLITKVSIL